MPLVLVAVEINSSSLSFSGTSSCRSSNNSSKVEVMREVLASYN